jgi:hypothetical protein
MSTYDVDSNIRIVVPTFPISSEIRDCLIGLGASPSKDLCTWTIDVESRSAANGIEETLERCLRAINDLKNNSWWSAEWATTVWITIASRGEFVGVAVSRDICKRAGEMDVDLVFSVYCRQEDSL